jgi:hypothetical protein
MQMIMEHKTLISLHLQYMGCCCAAGDHHITCCTNRNITDLVHLGDRDYTLAAIVMSWKQNQACCYCLMTNRILRKIKNQNTEIFKHMMMMMMIVMTKLRRTCQLQTSARCG